MDELSGLLHEFRSFGSELDAPSPLVGLLLPLDDPFVALNHTEIIHIFNANLQTKSKMTFFYLVAVSFLLLADVLELDTASSSEFYFIKNIVFFVIDTFINGSFEY